MPGDGSEKARTAEVLAFFRGSERALEFMNARCTGTNPWVFMVDLTGRIVAAEPDGPAYTVRAGRGAEGAFVASRHDELYMILDPDHEELASLAVEADSVEDAFEALLEAAGVEEMGGRPADRSGLPQPGVAAAFRSDFAGGATIVVARVPTHQPRWESDGEASVVDQYGELRFVENDGGWKVSTRAV